MSPTENDLRAALRRGEGDGPDPDAVVAAGRSRAARQRGRIAAVTGAAAVVLAVGTGTGLLLGAGRSGGQHSADSRAAGGPGRASSTAAAGGVAGATRVPPGADTAGCPTAFTAPHRLAGDPPASTPLIPSSASAILVCAYGSTGSGTSVTPGSTQLRGSDARRLIVSLNAASTSPPRGVCPMYRVADDHRLTFIGITANSATGPVSTTLGDPPCSVVVSNGSVTRYAWSPPADLKLKLFALQPSN